MKVSPNEIRKTLRTLSNSRAFPATFCPSEVARDLADDWRPLMPAIRREAAKLIAAGELECLQGGAPVEIEKAVGPIRLRAAKATSPSG
ncbi:MAG: DUF3253 domain-containing protein [Chthoniobacterales bacterium]|nr:DUF3253 domain-containing protein [Chthoniobacterales bacterium]